MNDNRSTDIDNAIRAALVNPDKDLIQAEHASDDRVRRELRARTALAATSTPRRWFVRRRLAPIVALGLVICAVVAFAPPFLDGGGGKTGSIPALPATASAREVLAWAGSALERDTTGGSGGIWHAVLRQHRDGQLVGVQDYWYSQDGDLRAEFGTNSFDGKGWASLNAYDGKVERIRTYELVDGQWRVPVHPAGPHRMSMQWDIPGGRAPSGEPLGGPPPMMWDRNGKALNADEQDLAKHPKRRVSATVSTAEAIHRWVRAAGKAKSDAELERATYIFLRTTRGEFLNDIRDRNEAAKRATTVRQLVRLMSVARLTPSASRAIYAQFAQLSHLKRLDDVTVGDRPAARIQYETGDISNTEIVIADPNYGAQRLQLEETVLVIDRETGVLLRTESLDRKRWTDYVRSERVEKIGDGAASCDTPPADAPCELLQDEGPLAERARQHARANNDDTDGFSISSPYNAHPWLGHLDADGLPLDDYDEPITWPSTPTEAEKLGVDYTTCSGRTGEPKADPHILYPDPNVYCDPLYPLAELPK